MSAYINYVKKYAEEHKLPFREAMKKASPSYKKLTKDAKKKQQKETKIAKRRRTYRYQPKISDAHRGLPQAYQIVPFYNQHLFEPKKNEEPNTHDDFGVITAEGLSQFGLGRIKI